MPGNPNIPLGGLNRIRASIIYALNPQLNVTSSYLGRRGITLTWTGDATAYLPQMTGAVTSPEPYIICNMVVHLVKAQGFAQLYKTQIELISTLGDATVRPDSPVMQPFNLSNAAIMTLGDLDFSGADADFPVRVIGTYQINSQLFT